MSCPRLWNGPRRLSAVYLICGLICLEGSLELIEAQSSVRSDRRSVPSTRPRLGMNLSGPADWNTELPLVDIFRFSRPWISQRQGAPWGKGPELDIDQHGWVQRLEPNCWAETLLCTIEGGHYPAGRYTVFHEGRGRLDFGGAARIVNSRPGRIEIDVNPERGAIFLRIRETDPNDYVRRIRVIMPGFEKTFRDDPFHPLFLQRWKGIACFRFMDWMHTNGSQIQSWNDRPTTQDATFTVKGMPLEWMIDLCNRQQADAWFCMPHQADDDYIRHFAEMVRDRLDPKRKVYLEYSNEVWNSIFAQNKYAQRRGRELGLGPAERPWEGGGLFYARRSAEIFRIWKEVFGGTDRLVRVLAWQAGNTWWMENIILKDPQVRKETDALAIAPYLGMNIRPNGDQPTAAKVASWSVDQVLDHVENHSLPNAIQAIRDSKRVADQYGLLLLAYEGGQHLVGVAGGENNEQMTQRFHQANAHPRMGKIYSQYLSAWTEAGGDLFCHFSSINRWGKWGSWGVLQYQDDNPRQSPKYSALIRWAQAQKQPMRFPQ